MSACTPSEMTRLLLSGKPDGELKSVAGRAKVDYRRVQHLLDGGSVSTEELHRLGEVLLRGRIFIKEEQRA